MGRRKQRSFEARFKEEAVRRMLNGESIMRLSREFDVARAVLYRWRDTYRAEGLAGLERRRGRPRPGQQVVSLKSRDPAVERIAELERLVGKQAAELDFFEPSLRCLAAREAGQRRSNREQLYAVINETRAEGRLSIEQACELAGVSRAGYYRQLARVKPAEADIELRDRMQRITLSNRRYGYRRVSAELHRQGFRVNHKKVLRLMRNDNLLAIRKRRYVLTTDSDQHRAAYPNWAQTLQVDGIDQLWQADITYVRMRRSFVYLAVVMDSYSRRVVGWELGSSLEAILALKALRQAIEFRRPKPGLVHHSDQGVQ